MTRNERELKAVDQEMVRLSEEIQAIWTKADKEDRAASDDERLDVEKKVKAIKTVLQPRKEEIEDAIKVEQDIKDVSRKLGPAVPSISVGQEPHDRLYEGIQNALPISKSLGEQFTDSKAYQKAVQTYRESGQRLPEGFSTGAVMLSQKGTLLEGAGSPGAGSGGGLLPVPQVVPGVVETLFQRLTVADLLLDGQATGNQVRYIVEGTATSGAAGVAEAAAKPESTLGLGVKDEPVRKIATFLPVSDEMLEDAPAVQSYINGRLMLFVRIEEERQLLRGVAGGNEVQGLLTSRNVPVYAGGTAAGNRAVQLFAAMNGQRGSAFVEPEWVILHPTDWQAIRLLTDTAGQFFGGGPFLGPYGGPQGPVGASGQLQGPQDQIWNKMVYVTAAIGGAGTALVGSRESAQIYRKGGISVEASNSHASFFQSNMIAIRAEERLALAVYRPSGFTEVRLA